MDDFSSLELHCQQTLLVGPALNLLLLALVLPPHQLLGEELLNHLLQEDLLHLFLPDGYIIGNPEDGLDGAVPLTSRPHF